MTNTVILAKIVTSLVTNVVATDNAKHEMISVPCPDGMIGCLVLHQNRGRVTPADRRVESTTVEEVRTAELEEGGRLVRTELSRRVVSRHEKTFELVQQWKETDSRELDLATNPKHWIQLATNSVFIGAFKTNITIK